MASGEPDRPTQGADGAAASEEAPKSVVAAFHAALTTHDSSEPSGDPAQADDAYTAYLNVSQAQEAQASQASQPHPVSQEAYATHPVPQVGLDASRAAASAQPAGLSHALSQHPLMPPLPAGADQPVSSESVTPTMQNLLMAWYWAGYYAGQHDAGSAPQPGCG